MVVLGCTMTYSLVELCRDLGSQEWAEDNVGPKFDKLIDQIRGTVGTLGPRVEDLDSDIPKW